MFFVILFSTITFAGMPDQSSGKENKISENDKVEEVNKNQKEAAGMPDMEGHGSVTAELEGVGGGGLIIEEVFAISTFPVFVYKTQPSGPLCLWQCFWPQWQSGHPKSDQLTHDLLLLSDFVLRN